MTTLALVAFEANQNEDIIRLMKARPSCWGISVVVFLTLAGVCLGQERFESGKYEGFTKATSFAIIERQDPFVVREARGIISFRDPLPNVLIEIRDAKGRITATRTDSHGQFKFQNLPDGTYMFKVTLDGFQSVIGTAVLKKSAKRSEVIRIEMTVGV